MVKARVKHAAASDPGRVRRNNEDAFYADPDRGIFLVVDGIGGQAAGEKAAEIAVDRIKARLERQTGTAEQRIREAITMANREILNAAREKPEWQGMACVLTVAVLEDSSAVIGHVGDSRLYRIGGGQISKITHDHSPVGEREDSNELTEAEAMRHPRRNEVFRDVGSEEHTPDDPDWIEVQRIPFEADNALLLCSDGLSDQVAGAEIRRAVERNAGNPERAVRELIEAANAAGGKDNVTVLVVEGEQFRAPADGTVELLPKQKTHGWLWLLAGLPLGAAALFGVLWQLGWRAPQPPPEGPKVLTVGAGQPLATITDALSQARPGDTVEVLAGDYREQVRLKEGVVLRSRVPREAVLLPVAMSSEPVVTGDSVNHARIGGFLIRVEGQTPPSAGIVLRNSDAEVDNMEVAGAARGIEVIGGNPTLLGNTVRDSTGEGILIRGQSRAWVLHNVIRHNKGAGLAAREGARPAVAGNVFEKNGKVEVPPETLSALQAQNFFLDVPRAARGAAAPR